jgi:hypothetical protein
LPSNAPAIRPTSARTLASRGRAAIASGLLAYLGLQAAISLYIDRWEPGLRDPEYGRKLALLKEAMSANPDRPLLLALGSSRTAYAYRPTAAPNIRERNVGERDTQPLAFNFGVLGGGPFYERMYFERLLAAGLRPRWLVVEIHPALLHPTPVNGITQLPDAYRCALRDTLLLARYVDAPAKLWTDWLALRLGTSYWYRGALVERFARQWKTAASLLDLNNLDETDGEGWVPGPWGNPSDAVRRQLTERATNAFAAALDDFRVGDAQRRALTDLLEDCRRERIDVRLCLMPESARFRQAYSRDAQRQINAFVTELEQVCGTPVIDASHWGDDDWFIDGQHMLVDGARAFSVRFARDGLRPWLADESGGPAASVARRREARSR